MTVKNEIKYLGRNLTNKIKDISNENYKTLLQKIEQYTQKLNVLCSCTGRINIVNMSILPKEIYRFSGISIKILY